MKWLVSACALAWAVGLPSTVLARDFRVKEIPNGVHFACQNCHTDNSGNSFTLFGGDSKSHLVSNGGAVSTEHIKWDKAFCVRDSDGDGKTNGEELGDPDCNWTVGDADPGGTVTNPGTSGDGLSCGNNAVDPGESCDGAYTKAFSCAELTLGQGLLGCTPDCAYDTSKCSGGPPPFIPSDDDGGEGCSTSEGDTSPFVALPLAVALVMVVASRRRK